MIGMGLFACVIWRLAQSVCNTNIKGPRAKSCAIGTALLASAVTHVDWRFTFEQAFDTPWSSGGGEKGLAAWVMSRFYADTWQALSA